MKHYPSISHSLTWDAEIYAFDKLDGSNIRAEWSRKRGEFYKFGSRSQLLDPADPVLGPAIGLIQQKYGAALAPALRDTRAESVICFFEFFGPSSFAGVHRIDENHDVVIFDIAPYKRGIIPPKDFVDLCVNVEIPRVLHVGAIDEDLISSVRDSTLAGMTLEGVVCKVANDPSGRVRMFKLKSEAWLSRLKQFCGNDERRFNELR